MPRRWIATAARVFTLAAVAAVVPLAAANATVKSTSSSSTAQSIVGAKWSAVATSAVPSGAPTGPLVLSVPLVGPPQYFWVTNTGTADLSDPRYVISYGVSAAGLGVGYLELRACVGASAAWNETLNICAGGTATQLTTTSTAAGGGAIQSPKAPGTRIRLQLNAVGISLGVTATINVAVAKP